MAFSDSVKFDNASLILIVSDCGTSDQLEKQLWQSVRMLGRLHCRTEVILVIDQKLHTNQSQVQELQRSVTYRPHPMIFPCLRKAIRAAKYPLIAIADGGVEIAPELWQLLKARSSQTPVQIAFDSSTDFASSKRTDMLKRVQLGVSGLITAPLLRTRKSDFRPGLTMLNRSPIAQLGSDEESHQTVSLDQLFAGLLPEQRLTCTAQLIALARVNGCPVGQVDLGSSNSGSSSSTSTPNSKTIRRSTASSVRFWWNTMMFPRRRFELKAQLGGFASRKVSWPKQFAIVSVLMLVAVFCLFYSLGFAFFEPDEARNAQLALNVVESGQWLSLTLNQEPYWDKPPLQIWAIAASYQTFGVSQWATRLPGAIASLLTVLMTVIIGKRLVGFRAAALGTFLLLITAGFLFTGRYVTMDATLTATTTATLLLGFLAIRDRMSKPIAVAAGVACGIGVLTKGPVALVLCLPPLVVANWLLAKQPGRSKTKNRWAWFVVPTCLVAAPWFVATSWVHPEFLSYFFWKHHVVRFSAAFNHRAPFWYYPIGIFLFMFPASYLLPSTARFLTSRKPENRLWRTREHGMLFLSVAWIIGFFTLSQSKLPTYIVPSFPLICLLMGVLLERKLLGRGVTVPDQVAINPDLWLASESGTDSVSHLNSRRSFFDGLPRRAPLELVFWISVGSIVLLTMFPGTSVSLFGMLLSVALIGLLSVFAVRKKSKPKLAWGCFGLLALFATGMIVHRIIPAAAQHRSIHVAAYKLKHSERFEGAPLVFFGRESYGATMIHDPADVKFFQETQVKQLVEFLSDNPTAIIVASDDPMKTLRSDLPWSIRLDQCEDARHLYTSQINQSVQRSGLLDEDLGTEIR